MAVFKGTGQHGDKPAAQPKDAAARPVAKVATPLRRRGAFEASRSSPAASASPTPELPRRSGAPASRAPAGHSGLGRPVQDTRLRRGDVVTVCKDFDSNSLIRVKILQGWKGHVVRLDAEGDALVSFTDQVKLLWVSRQHFAHLEREPPPAAAAGRTPREEVEEVAVSMPEVASERTELQATAAPPVPCMKGDRGFPVWLHVYDLGQVSRLVLNSWAAQGGGLGGAFHCGIEVLGVEFSFQAISSCQEDDDTSGVTWHSPKAHPRHVYRESVWLGATPLAVSEIGQVLERLEKCWPARDYHCLRNNCTDFAEQLALELRVPRSFPRWAHGVAKSPLLAVAGGCCAPLVTRTPSTRLFAPCYSGSCWSSADSLPNTGRSTYTTDGVQVYPVEADGSIGI